MREYYLAVDIGASGGRHILGWLDENGLLKTKEVYRFPNGLRKVNGHLCWDLPELFRQILEGLQMCGELGMIPSYMGIDTWAVDFVLLDEWGMVLGDTVGYRDNRTQGMEQYIYDKIPEQDLYARTGIQKQPFNTIYQMEAVRRKQPGLMRRAKRMLMIPDYFHYLLTGVMAAEYTNATTTQLVSPVTKDWDWDLIDTLGYSRDLFCPIRTPGSILGTLRPEHKARLGFDVQVILPPTHDTASAVLAVPSPGEIPLYISSGTWSLMGTELRHADCSARSQRDNFTNEGGAEYRFRYLKNIMGLWMIQSVKKELGQGYSYEQLCQMAREYDRFPSRVQVNDARFLAPDSMTQAVREYCAQTDQQPPEAPGQLLSVLYHSLAESYGETVRELEQAVGASYPALHIVGGGCRDGYLNELTSAATGKQVLAGPAEATAIGNILGQMLGRGVFDTVDQVRECVKRSTDLGVFEK